jgi:hypothetical protein
MRFFLSVFVAVLFSATLAFAGPAPTTSLNLSGTIGATSTFQSIQAQNLNRIGCTIQNNGSSGNAMYVFFGPKANATTGASIKLSTGQSVRCNSSATGYVLPDQVSIAGTSGDAFFANFQ